MTLIAHGERSEPCAYQTLTDSPSAEGSCYLPRRLRSQILRLIGPRYVRFFGARLNPFLGVYGKNEDYHRLRFFVLFVVVYFVFSVDAFFMAKIAKQNRLFFGFFSAFFQKSQNMSHGNCSSTFVF